MKVVALVSGGKDSCFAMMRCIDFGHEIVALANLVPLDDSVDELDSYMYQTVGHQILTSYAQCMGLPLFRRRIRGSTRDQQLNYTETPGDEVEDMYILLREIKRQIPSVNAVSSGAIASDYQRLRVESVCSRLGLVSLAYLWKQDQAFLLEEMIRRGIIAIVVKVAAMGLKPAEHVGKELVDLKLHLFKLKERYGINVCGEGGEYETLTLDCPLFHNAKIILDKFQVLLDSPDSIAPVGILHPLAFHIEEKVSSSSSSVNAFGSDELNYLCEVEDSLSDHTVSSYPLDLTSDGHDFMKTKLCIATARRNLFSIGCWIQSPRGSDGLQQDLAIVLRSIERRLKKDGFDWMNVLYIHLYLTNMKEFAIANEVYVKFITDKNCYLGVPSRSTIELPLADVGLGNAYVEVLVGKEQVKRVLHVQSISCWAPSCIGPYSQATLYKEVLYMAGQLGLYPPTMMLCSGGPTSELEQALQNSEAVANCFSTSIYESTFLFVAYCASHLTLSERIEVQEKLQFSFESHYHSSRRVPVPSLLFVLAPDLPKGACVEVKPILYIPDTEGGIETRQPREMIEPKGLQPAFKNIVNHSILEDRKLYDSCCQIRVVNQKICSAIVSVSDDVARKICYRTGKGEKSLLCSSEKNLDIIARFCAFVLSEILSENNFSWEDLVILRFYYPTNLNVAADAMTRVFSEAFAELAEAENCFLIDGEPIFNVVPVLGSGQLASANDTITCELFASKL